MNKILFREEQNYRQLWVRLALTLIPAAIIIIFSYGIYHQIVLNEPFGSKPMQDNQLIIIGLICSAFAIGLAILFFKTRMIVIVFTDKIILKYPPFVNREILYNKDEIASFQIRKYKPIREYGGWGVRKKKDKKMGKAYNISGNIGLQLVLKNGEKILLGTQRSRALENAMKKMMTDG